MDQTKSNRIKSENFIIWATNVDVLTKEKLTELKYRIGLDQTPPHIIALSEVRPKQYKHQRDLADYQLDGYNIEHRNVIMRDPSGRGLIVYVKETITCNLHEPATKFEEAIIVNTKLSNNDFLTLGLL